MEIHHVGDPGLGLAVRRLIDRFKALDKRQQHSALRMLADVGPWCFDDTSRRELHAFVQRLDAEGFAPAIEEDEPAVGMFIELTRLSARLR